MEKVKNPYFKAVSIISLVFAIIMSVSIGLILLAALSDLEYFVDFFLPVIIEDELGSSEVVMDAQGSALTMLVMMAIYMGGLVAFLFVAYAKLKKYAQMTNEEAKAYSGRIIAWIVVMFLFSGILSGGLMLAGYLTVTQKQIESLNTLPNAENKETNNSGIANENKEVVQDLDTMIERLEKLNRIKEMGGLTDEEYEELRKKIVNGK